MYTSRQRICSLAITLAAAASLAIALPVAHAGDKNTRSSSSQCPCNSGLPDGPESARVVEASSQPGQSSQCPCNSDLIGGPGIATPVASSPLPVIRPRGGFHWTDAGVGAGAMLGIVLLMAGLGAGMRTAHRGRAAAGSA